MPWWGAAVRADRDAECAVVERHHQPAWHDSSPVAVLVLAHDHDLGLTAVGAGVEGADQGDETVVDYLGPSVLD
ncbi:hypothetical protein R4P64_29260 [Rhodococcus sp. IEGM 1366]|uniref:hypothetical protein n=1 Tax=Rhodococcus sp. IEGM 1366 TaxID=3082223 RepID=UPI002955850B|nr:hypothetical protein [Rhodococcus sp. IEGM 1366]MDV8070629.1 hypothetical protein [Rhodococcus sp. IEGM 1366]